MIAIVPLVLNCVQYTTAGQYYKVQSKNFKQTHFIGDKQEAFKVGNDVLLNYFKEVENSEFNRTRSYLQARV